MKKLILNFILFLTVGICMTGCIEPFEIESTSFESALVVEATITNEVKQQQVSLTRSFPLEADGPIYENNAKVTITDDQNTIYTFSEISPGKYISDLAFEALSNRNYQLKIVTEDGRSYSSEQVQLTSPAQIENVYAEPHEDGLGLTVFVDSYNTNGDSRYYKYEYEETYKIIAPRWYYLDLVVTSEDPLEFDFVPRDINTRVCYNTILSDGILQTETNNFTEDRVTKFPVRSVYVNDKVIAYRYSILVKQYVQTLEAFTFFKTLKDLSESESLFSQKQPGFFSGNISADENFNEKVIGFFEACAVTSERIFIDPVDLDLKLPFPRPFPYLCELVAPEIEASRGNLSLLEYLESNSLKYYGLNDGISWLPRIKPGGPYVMVPYACGDCTVLGTNVVPEFWIE